MLARLQRILPPPSAPLERPTSAQWKDTEARLGVLPEDYKRFIDLYGTGCIDCFLWIFNPFAQNENLRLDAQADRQLDVLRSVAESEPDHPATAIISRPQDLLPVGITDNGDVICWRKVGDPDGWTTCVFSARGQEHEEYPAGLVAFLCTVLSRAVRSRLFPRDFPGDAPTFSPLSQRQSGLG
jgi:hypothetical protein